MTSETERHVLLEFYEALYAAYGPRGWWPADSPTEVVIGAILTQNTAWANVEKAIRALRETGSLDFAQIDAMDTCELGEVIRSAGTYRVKAARLKAFARWLQGTHGGDLRRALDGNFSTVREDLLSVRGIGPETADAILLYAGLRPTFVVDAYTKRLLRRHRIGQKGDSYAHIKALFERNLPREAALFNEYHALIVEVGKRHCRARAACDGCPLSTWPHDESQ